MDPMGYVYMVELIDFNISKESFWRSLFGSGGIWQSAWVHLLHDLDNLRHTEIYSLKNTCRVIIDHLFDCWMVLFPCLRFPVFGYFFICKTAKPPAATMRMSCWHHRSSSLLASSLQCWRCRDLVHRHTVDGQSLSPVDMVNISLFTGFDTCQLVVWDLWTIKQYSEISGGSVFLLIRFLRCVLGFQFWHGQTPPYFIPRCRLPLHLQLWLDFIFSNEAITTWIPNPTV